MAPLQNIIGDLLLSARRALNNNSETPALDAELLLGLVLKKNRTWLLAHSDKHLTKEQIYAFHYLLAQRVDGMPLPYLLGEWEFFGRKFKVTPDVLIPRPETEMLVEIAIEWIKERPGPVKVLDVGTGSGCIAISIALGCPDARVLGVDLSYDAIEIASLNGKRLKAENVEWAISDLLEGLPGTKFPLDLICANLPYIPTSTWENLEVSVHEPRLALDGGPDGLNVIRRLLEESSDKLNKNGMMLLEVESGHGDSGPALAREYFPRAEIELIKDLAGHPRFVQIIN